MSVRLRYAPSPTGDPHVGNIRTALWSWLHARRLGGAFVLRLEDTDQSRAVEGSLERIEGSLRWLGIDWDEGPREGGPFGPYVQSERLERYREATDRLLADGNAYRCFCTPEEIDAMRREQQKRRRPPGYTGVCRPLDAGEAAARAASGESHVLRFRMPREGSTTFEDLIRGPITYENRVLDDFVILKSDGYPTYHLAHVVDDHAMEITHVTRGDEWIPSTPRHVRLFEALGYEPPIFVHTPVILGPGGGKLSKRDGAKSVLEYAADGYLPEALLNFLAITGWAPDGSTEIIARDDLVAAFDLARLNPAPATFDTDKLEWMNGVYMRSLPPGRPRRPLRRAPRRRPARRRAEAARRRARRDVRAAHPRAREAAVRGRPDDRLLLRRRGRDGRCRASSSRAACAASRSAPRPPSSPPSPPSNPSPPRGAPSPSRRRCARRRSRSGCARATCSCRAASPSRASA